MIINGYALQQRLKELGEQRKLLTGQFSESLHQFPSDTGKKLHPQEILDRLEKIEAAMVRVELAQTFYNQAVKVEIESANDSVNNQTVSLQEAIKRLGGINRMEGLWKEAAGNPTKKNRYDFMNSGSTARQKDTEYAERVIPVEECLEKAREFSREASKVRKAVQLGNSTSVNVDLVSSEDFKD